MKSFAPLKPLGPFVLNRNCSQADGLVGWWPGYPRGGGQIFDLARKNHLTLTSFSNPYTITSGWAPGYGGGSAVQFDGTDDYAMAGGAAVTTYPCTLMAWAKLTTTPVGADSAQVLMAVADPTSIAEFRIDIVRISNVNYLRSVCESDAGANEREIRATYTVDNNWHLYAATFIDSSTHQVYVDGVLLTGSYLTAGTGTPSPAGISKTFLGSQIYNTSSQYGPWNGLIEDARVYNRTVTATTMMQAFRHRTRWELRYLKSPKSYSFPQPAAPPPPVATDRLFIRPSDIAQTFPQPSQRARTSVAVYDTTSVLPSSDWVPTLRQRERTALIAPQALPTPVRVSPPRFSPAADIPDSQPFRVVIPFAVPYEESDTQRTKRSRDHEQKVAKILNSLMRSGELKGTIEDGMEFGYVPANSQHWAPGAPETIKEALDKIATLLKSLNGGVGP